MKRLYAAYGSNLNLEQMSLRCSSAKLYGKGIIDGYRLIFKGQVGNSYASIEPFAGGKVPVLIWELQEDDEKNLDYYEGYPRFYEKEILTVEPENKELIEVMVYIMTDERTELNPPSQRYLNSIKDGYITAGFDLEILKDALKNSRGWTING